MAAGVASVIAAALPGHANPSQREVPVMMRNLLYLTLLLWAITPAFADAPRTFREAKKVASDLYRDHQTTFYCGCDYHKLDGKLRVDLASCGYQVRKQQRRAERVEWEHVVPAWWLGHQRQCWQNGGRKNCRQTDPLFNQAEADLHNLVPSIGEINADRSNYRFGMVTSSQYGSYGGCPMKIDFKQEVAEPPARVRGDIARIYLYMSQTYGIRLSRQQRRLLEIWSKQDPEDAWELEKNRRIAAIMQSGYQRAPLPEPAFPQPTASAPATDASHQCGSKRYCKEMASCKEARWFLENCGLSKLDRDKDGVPCEALCR
jgi:deoxyribonuclease-1